MSREFEIRSDSITVNILTIGQLLKEQAKQNPYGIAIAAPSRLPLTYSRLYRYTAVPTIHQAILAAADNGKSLNLHSPLRFIRSGGAALPVKVMKALEELFSAPVLEGYGMTETGSIISINPLPPRQSKPGSVGIAAGLEIGIMDEAGHLLSSGEIGEIVVRGENVMSEYENNPAANQNAISISGDNLTTTISVLMPAYNASVFIAPAIESILNQTFQDFELIIVDDGSTDNTVDIIKSYIDLDKRIKIIQIGHAGICHALNIGIQESKYSWIARMDADDVALPRRLEKQINAAQANPQVVIWGSYVQHISSTGQVLSLQKHGPITEEEYCSLIREGEIPYVPHPTMLIRKDVLLKAGGYDPQFTVTQDLDLVSRMSEHGPILVVPEPLLLYRVHRQAASMQKFFLQQLFVRCIVARHQARIAGVEIPEVEQVIEAEKKQPLLARFTKDLRLLGQFWYRKAGLLVSEKRYLRAACYLTMTFVVNPTYSVPRIWKQRLSPKARRCLIGSGKNP